MTQAFFAESAALIHFFPTNSGSNWAEAQKLKTVLEDALLLVEININHHLSPQSQSQMGGVLETT